MCLTSALTVRRVRAFERHVQVTKQIGAQVFEAMGSMVCILLTSGPVKDELMVGIHRIIELQILAPARIAVYKEREIAYAMEGMRPTGFKERPRSEGIICDWLT